MPKKLWVRVGFVVVIIACLGIITQNVIERRKTNPPRPLDLRKEKKSEVKKISSDSTGMEFFIFHVSSSKTKKKFPSPQ